MQTKINISSVILVKASKNTLKNIANLYGFGRVFKESEIPSAAVGRCTKTRRGPPCPEELFKNICPKK